jgi:trimethylamine:corrinoid methyltransferase-like protein
LRFEPLSPEQLQLMHDETLKILDEVGAIIEGEEAREILIGAGCREQGKDYCFRRRWLKIALVPRFQLSCMV